MGLLAAVSPSYNNQKSLFLVSYRKRYLSMPDIQVEIIHNASVMGAVASCGLQLYNFGQTVSIPLWEENWEPDSFYEKIKANKEVRCIIEGNKAK